MRIFITGGTGFIGRHLVSYFINEGHSLMLLSRKNVKAILPKLGFKSRVRFLKGDLTDIQKLSARVKNFKPEVAIHLAWEGIPDPDLRLNIKNLIGGLNCIEVLAKIGCKKIFVCGSCHEYGEPNIRVTERFSPEPYNILYAAKTSLYFLGSKIAEKYGMKFIWGRIFFVYGPGQRKASLIPYIFDSIRKNMRPVIKNPKGGNDFIYVDDVVRAISMIIKKGKLRDKDIFNIGSGRLTGVGQLASEVYNSLGLEAPKNIKKIRKPIGFYADISKIKREIGWRPKIDIKTGVKKTIDFYRNG